ncbi:hypothetical protein niasHT_018746 [Heterodera trifolii]|uniref:BTB domain-containing protein n=1 Tax=Heterodera trifolii TaxID=157864 RepID=A0ABD2LCX3_9BILA
MPKAGIAGLKSILSTGEYSDVHFLLVPAHKGILKFASDVFEAMFRFEANKEQGENVSANCPTNVEIPDVEAAAFKVMLSFIYTEDLSELNGDNAMAVLYAAKKYNIPDLADASLQIPISDLRNVFFAYAQALLFELELFALKTAAHSTTAASRWGETTGYGRSPRVIRRRLIDWRGPFGPPQSTACGALPSGVLTAGEVIGVKKYHNNPNGISEGILYPLPFPSRKRIRTFGIISMDIEKVSQFALEAFGSSRYSEKLYINGFQWEILAQIKMQYRGTYVKWLGIYLLCTASEKAIWSERKSKTVRINGLPLEIVAQINHRTEGNGNDKCLSIFLLCSAYNDENWSCKCLGTFRVVSQKSDMADYRKEFNDQLLNNRTPSRGYANVISFAELMDPSKGFYNKSKDKVTLAIDFTVEEAKTEDNDNQF